MATTFGQYGKNRFWEVVPGFLIWSTFILALGASFFYPVAAAVFIIIFDLYWALRVLYFLIYLSVAYKNFKRERSTDWLQKVEEIKDWGRIEHVIFLPTYKEGITILRKALKSLDASSYPNKKIHVYVGGEEGDKEQFESHKKELTKEFSGVFASLNFTLHPKGLEGEIPGKGSNLKWVAEKAKVDIDSANIPYENIIVSAFDVDTIPHPQYLARLAHAFLTVKDPLRASYQPVVLFSNNIWESSAPVRVAAFGTTFWLMSELMRPERLWTFSSHSMSWQMLVDVGFWEPDLVSEDSRIFMQGLLHYDGDYRVEPLFIPVHMDAVEGESYLDGLKALYKQQRRWAWGVEHLPYMMTQFKNKPLIPRLKKLKYIFNHIEGMYTWASAPMLIFVLGYLPFFIAQNSTESIITNSPFTLQFMMQIATLGVFASAILSLFLLPHRPHGKHRRNWIVMIAQWALLPITFVVFGAFPAIDAQTRFMLGKYLGFNVTKKKG